MFRGRALQGGIELSNGFLFIDSRVALKSLHDRVKGKRQRLRKLRLAAAGRAFDQNRLPQLARYVHLGERDLIDDVLGFLEFLAELID